MFLYELYKVIDDDTNIQVSVDTWDTSDYTEDPDGIIFEGRLSDSYEAVDPYMYQSVSWITTDDQGNLCICADLHNFIA